MTPPEIHRQTPNLMPAMSPPPSKNNIPQLPPKKFTHILPNSRLGTSHPSHQSYLSSVPQTTTNQTKYTLVILTDSPKRHILLGLKNRGFGTGFYNSFGGKIDSCDASPASAAVRELKEETNIDADVDRMSEGFVGKFCFTFEDEKGKEMVMYVFRLEVSMKKDRTVTTKNGGGKKNAKDRVLYLDPEGIKGCEEITPRWFEDWYDIPLDNMFADDSIWLTEMLSQDRRLSEESSAVPKMNGWFHYKPGGTKANAIRHYYLDTIAQKEAPIPQKYNPVSDSSTFAPWRIIMTMLFFPPLCYCYGRDLVEQMGGSFFKAGSVLLFALVCGLVDMNDMSGQPEGEHEHDHHD